MERLTYEKSQNRWDEGKHPTRYTSRHTFQEVVARLAAYENTGLGPNEITTEPYGCVFYLNRKCNLDGDWCAEGPGCPYEINAETAKHLLELARAEKDGRLVVLPCKVGDMLFAGEDSPVLPLVLADIGLVLDGPNGWDWESLSNVGKTVFLTREEAEAALKKMEEADNEAD